ncbi:MAG TPA: hypothetical protein GXX20_03315 [Clostridiaceae bacterium]|nr:hypothetical protein [Clostridiaceae bacterium]
MVIENIKRLAKESKIFIIALTLLVITLSWMYFLVFFTKGVVYDEVFLKKEVIGADTHYIGKGRWGQIHITVKGIKGIHDNIEVIYRLPNNIVEKYEVGFEKNNEDFREKVVIKDINNNIIFEGRYREGDIFLFDKNEEPFIEGIGHIIINDQNPYKSDYKIYLKSVVSFASGEGEQIRGDVRLLVISIFLIIITVIDIKYPLFFFRLRHSLSVENPEPSDFYITMQRISWCISPIIILIGLLAAIF